MAAVWREVNQGAVGVIQDREVLDFRLGRCVYRFEKHYGNKFHMTC